MLAPTFCFKFQDFFSYSCVDDAEDLYKSRVGADGRRFRPPVKCKRLREQELAFK